MSANEVLNSREYGSFRSSVPLKKIVVDSNGTEWTFFDTGPKEITTPLVLLPPLGGTADVFFRQLLFLGSLGYRLIAVSKGIFLGIGTVSNSLEFRRILSFISPIYQHFESKQASLGGFLALKFAEVTEKNKIVASFILNNSFIDTRVVRKNAPAKSYWIMPSFLLKKIISKTIEESSEERHIKSSDEFMRLRGELACRLSLNASSSYVCYQIINNIPTTIIDVCDDSYLSQQCKDDIYQAFPDAKKAFIKSGGNFPFLSRSPEINMHIQIHLRQFSEGPLSPLVTPTSIIKEQEDKENSRLNDISSEEISERNSSTSLND